MNDLKNLKETHEVAACQRFLSIYNETQNSDIKIIRLGDPNKKEPDCICSNNFAIELAGVYDNSYQAEKVWSVARKKNVSKQPDYRLFSLDNLQNEIGTKLSKLNGDNYSGFSGEIILVCNLHSPLLEDCEVENYLQSYASFREDGHFERYFHQIWITWKSAKNGDWKIKKLE
jgi:hypothetical protein